MKKSVLDELTDVIATPVADEKLGVKPATKEARVKAIKAVEDDINKSFKTVNSIIRMGDKVGIPIPSICTNLPSLDYYVIQTGGIPRGRIIELFGPESSGKTTIALYIIGQEQKNGELCAFIDAEHAIDPTWASKLGVNVEDLFISQPDSGEQALETVIGLVKSRAVSLIVVDSVAALVPQAELDGEMGDSHMGLQARLMSQAMRKLRGICEQTGITVIFINQIREKIGVMFGSPETTTGGRALKFYASLRLDVRRIGAIKDGDVQIGQKMRVKAVKNKVGSPFKETELDLYHDTGIDTFSDLVTYSVSQGVINKSGAWYDFEGERLGQGISNVKDFLSEHKEILEKIVKKLNPKDS